MSYNVHLHVCFHCTANEGVASLAQTHLATLGYSLQGGGRDYARDYLRDLAKRTGINPGPKGGMSLWGMICNGINSAEDFVVELRPFWAGLLSMDGKNGGPLDFEHVLIFYQGEQDEEANAYEVCWDNYDLPDRQLLVKNHKRLPFSWL